MEEVVRVDSTGCAGGTRSYKGSETLV